jgi:hypothetical protein
MRLVGRSRAAQHTPAQRSRLAGVVAATGLSAFLFAGCATQATLTISSTPDGAYITENGSGKAYGVTPVTVYYDSAKLINFKGQDGCFRVRGFEARWVSGTTARLQTVRLCGSKTGGYTITFSRDTSAPGFAQDMQFSLQLQQLRAQQQQARAAQEAAAAALFQALSPQKTTFFCTTTQYGSIAQTTCR